MQEFEIYLWCVLIALLLILALSRRFKRGEGGTLTLAAMVPGVNFIVAVVLAAWLFWVILRSGFAGYRRRDGSDV